MRNEAKKDEKMKDIERWKYEQKQLALWMSLFFLFGRNQRFHDFGSIRGYFVRRSFTAPTTHLLFYCFSFSFGCFVMLLLSTVLLVWLNPKQQYKRPSVQWYFPWQSRWFEIISNVPFWNLFKANEKSRSCQLPTLYFLCRLCLYSQSCKLPYKLELY